MARATPEEVLGLARDVTDIVDDSLMLKRGDVVIRSYVAVDAIDFQPVEGQAPIFIDFLLVQDIVYDETSEPRGKWLDVVFIRLGVLPMIIFPIKMQPPHICMGRHYNPERTAMFTYLRLDVDNAVIEGTVKSQDELNQNIVQAISRDRSEVIKYDGVVYICPDCGDKTHELFATKTPGLRCDFCRIMTCMSDNVVKIYGNTPDDKAEAQGLGVKLV